MTDRIAFQDDVYFKGNHCWGCGNENSHGLNIKSYWDGNESVCTWKPEDFHTAGWPHVLYGGIEEQGACSTKEVDSIPIQN
jgi:hypothetical protein